MALRHHDRIKICVPGLHIFDKYLYCIKHEFWYPGCCKSKYAHRHLYERKRNNGESKPKDQKRKGAIEDGLLFFSR